MRLDVLVFGILFFIQASALADPLGAEIDPFDSDKDARNISVLTCGQLYTMISNHDKNLFPVAIWIHGLASGLDKKTRPFSEKEPFALLNLTAELCASPENRNKTIFNVYLDLRK